MPQDKTEEKKEPDTTLVSVRVKNDLLKRLRDVYADVPAEIPLSKMVVSAIREFVERHNVTPSPAKPSKSRK